MLSRENNSPDACYKNKAVLITGGLGFIGSNLAARLVACGARVTIVDALLPNAGGNVQNVAEIRDDVCIELSDLRDHNALPALVSEKEFIFHLAGLVSHGDSMRDPQIDLDVNCVATMNLLESCRRHNQTARLLYTSTRQVYGRPVHLPVDELHPTLPIDVNGINKLAAEYYHLLYDTVYGIQSTVLRLTNTYGPRQKLNSDRQGVAAVFIQRALQGGILKLYGGGTQLRDFNYVDDVVDAMMLALAEPRCHGHVFNLGAPQPHTLLDFVNHLSRWCDFETEPVPFPEDNKLIDIGDYYGDFTRFRNATGWKPRISLFEGLKLTIAAHRASAISAQAGVRVSCECEELQHAHSAL
jgi:UDP-glucose 4-epimerase